MSNLIDAQWLQSRFDEAERFYEAANQAQADLKQGELRTRAFIQSKGMYDRSNQTQPLDLRKFSETDLFKISDTETLSFDEAQDMVDRLQNREEAARTIHYNNSDITVAAPANFKQLQQDKLALMRQQEKEQADFVDVSHISAQTQLGANLLNASLDQLNGLQGGAFGTQLKSQIDRFAEGACLLRPDDFTTLSDCFARILAGCSLIPSTLSQIIAQQSKQSAEANKVRNQHEMVAEDKQALANDIAATAQITEASLQQLEPQLYRLQELQDGLDADISTMISSLTLKTSLDAKQENQLEALKDLHEELPHLNVAIVTTYAKFTRTHEALDLAAKKLPEARLKPLQNMQEKPAKKPTAQAALG